MNSARMKVYVVFNCNAHFISLMQCSLIITQLLKSRCASVCFALKSNHSLLKDKKKNKFSEQPSISTHCRKGEASAACWGASGKPWLQI